MDLEYKTDKFYHDLHTNRDVYIRVGVATLIAVWAFTIYLILK
jgi:hypothetical protein